MAITNTRDAFFNFIVPICDGLFSLLKVLFRPNVKFSLAIFENIFKI